MEFLDINYSEVPGKEVDDNFLNGILFLVDKGLESKDLQDPIVLSQELDKGFQKQLVSVGEVKPNTQEKAIVTALFSRYPKMLEDKSDVKEFKEHLTNLFKAKEMTDGAVKYLIERLMQPDTLEKGGAPAPAQVPPPQVDPAQASKAQTQPAQQGKGGPAQVAETNNSEEDESFYDEWFSSYDVESELTDKDFSEMVKDCNIGKEYKMNPARKFIRGKLMDKELSYGMTEGFRRAATFIIRKESEYSRGGTLVQMASPKDHNDGYNTGDEIIKVNKDQTFKLDKRGNLMTKTMEKPKIDK